jgi:hypothetical protein
MFSFRAIFSSAATVVAFFLSGIAASLLLAAVLRVRRAGVLWGAVALIVFFSLYCLASYSAARIGRTRASQQMVVGNDELPSIQVDLDQSKVDPVLISATAVAQGDYKLALLQPERIWIFKPASKDKPNIAVFMIPKAAIKGISIQRSTNQELP